MNHYARTLRRFLTCITVCLLFTISASVWSGAAHAEATPTTDAQLAQIHVLDAYGHPVQQAQILAMVVPTNLNSKQWNGTPYPVAGTGTTNATGNIQIHLQVPDASQRNLRGTNNVVNYELYLIDSSGHPAPLGAIARYYGTDAKQAQEYATSTVRPTVFHMSAATTPRKAITNAQVSPNNGCIPYWVTVNQGDFWTTVGELHAAPWASAASFTYGSQADTNVGVAYSSNSGSTWGISGSVNISNTVTGSATRNVPANTWFAYQQQGLFHYIEQQQYDTCLPGGDSNFQIMATQWDGGLQDGAYVGSSDNSPNKYTIALTPAEKWSRISNAAYTYSAAASVFGATISAQSGFSNTVSINYTVDPNYPGGYLYGNDNFPLQSTIIYVATYCPAISSGCPGAQVTPPSGTSACTAHANNGLVEYCDAPHVNINCGGNIGGGNDLDGIPIQWTYTNGTSPCVYVNYFFSYSNAANDCVFYLYVPDGDATANVRATVSNGTTQILNENPVSGWQHWFDGTGITSLTFTDGNGQPVNQYKLGWGKNAGQSIARICSAP